MSRKPGAIHLQAFHRAVDRLNLTIDGWRLAMRRIGSLEVVSEEIQAAFLNVWIESKALPRKVGHRRTLSDALRVLMPGNSQGSELRLFRGTTVKERRHRLYGFSWTTQIDIARGFADRWTDIWGEADVLETTAPPEAVFLIREEEGYYDENEVVVDPFKLSKISVVERFVNPAGGKNKKVLNRKA